MFMQLGRQDGFTFVGVLLLAVVVGLGLADTARIWHVAQQRDRERELLFVGDQFRQAIGGYFEGTPGPAKAYPRSLEDLLKDPRYLPTRRYLRRVYIDPITGTTGWGLVKAPDGGIVGVYSLSERRPLKTGGFAAAEAAFEGKKSYADWKFVYLPAQPPGTGPIPTPGAAPARTGQPPSQTQPR
jgi:type II secretory pathway pseudopilin PulG